MKCPECGSLLEEEIIEDCYIYYCSNPRCDYDSQYSDLKPITDEEIYQARLDKVLEKFEHVYEDNEQLEHWFYEIDETVGTWYINYDPDTLFSFEHDNITFVEGVSLETVESLLKDLENDQNN